MKEFNITGTCIPEMHYMVDTSNKIDEISKLIEKGKYFIINRPRQYGKTTTLYLLNKNLRDSEEYLPIKISFEVMDSESYKEVKSLLRIVMKQIKNYFRFSKDEDMYEFVSKYDDKIERMDQLSDFITDIAEYTKKKIVLIIDEVDKSSNNQIFLDLLGMLRNKYLLKNEGQDYTFHSVILAGVHDVKNLKLKVRPDEEHKYNSPWNIATDFDIDMSFSSTEIMTMLDEYCNDKKIKMDKVYFSEKLHYYTSGHPFLISKICKTIDEKIMHGAEWEKEYIEMAVKDLLKESNTNFESLIKNLENNTGLFETVKKLLIKGIRLDYNIHNPDIGIGILYGIFRNDTGRLKINNRIYEQLIYNYMISTIQTSSSFENYNDRAIFLNEDGTLNIKKVLTKFQDFMKHEYSDKSQSFLEENGRLLFLAFLSPIINGTGFAFKEVKGGEEKRFDIVITYEKKMYIIELKIWYGEEYHKRGLLQLGEYLEQYGLAVGYLLIFDFRKGKSLAGNVEEVRVRVGEMDKEVMEVYC